MYVRSRGFGQTSSEGSSFNPASLFGPIASLATTLFNFTQTSATQRDDTTSFANFAEVQMQNNLTQFQNCQISQATAEANFNTIWLWLVQQCSQPQFGTAGGACVHDRQAGGKFDWFAGYLTPIQTSTVVCPDTSAATTNSGASSTLAGIPSSYLWIGGGLLAAWLVTR